MSASAEQGVRIGLSAVVITLRDRKACVLTTAADGGGFALPFGPFDPARDRTFELALRNFVTAQTGFRLGFVEQLDEVDVTGVEAMTSVMPMQLRRREDKVTDGGYADRVVANAPLSEDNFFMVPKVVE